LTHRPPYYFLLWLSTIKNQKSNSGIIISRGKGKRDEGKEITSSSMTGQK
jgi:hypothetical protein